MRGGLQKQSDLQYLGIYAVVKRYLFLVGMKIPFIKTILSLKDLDYKVNAAKNRVDYLDNKIKWAQNDLEQRIIND